MKTICHIYEDEGSLSKFIDLHLIKNSNPLLIQAFVVNWSIDEIEALRLQLSQQLPNAVIIGCNSSGSLINGQIEHRTVLVFTQFSKVALQTSLITDDCTMNEPLQANDDLKAAIVIASDHTTLLTTFLNNLSEKHPAISIAGGIGQTANQIVFTEKSIAKAGIAAVYFKGVELDSFTIRKVQPQMKGPTFKVTEACGRVLKKLNKELPLNLFEQYAGLEQGMALLLNREFPIIKSDQNGNEEIFIEEVYEDGTLLMSDELRSQDRITLSLLRPKEFENELMSNTVKINEIRAETIFCFHSIAHLQSKESLLKEEFQLIDHHTNMSGMLCKAEIIKHAHEAPQIGSFTHIYFLLSESMIKKNKIFTENVNDSKHSLLIQDTLTQMVHSAVTNYEGMLDRFSYTKDYNRSIFNNHPDIIFTLDLDGNFTGVNKSFTNFFGKSFEDVKGIYWLKIFSDHNKSIMEKTFKRAIRGNVEHFEIQVKTVSGNKEIFQTYMIPIHVKGNCVEVFVVGRNITEQLALERKMEQLAFYDSETGLPNRNKFEELLEKHITRAKKARMRVPIFLIKIDRIKTVNDIIGYHAGDRIRKDLANRIKSALPDSACIGRFATDKFSVFIPGIENDEEIKDLCLDVIHAVNKPFLFDNQEFYITASIGVSTYPNHGNDYASLLKNADTALNQTEMKMNEKNIVFFANEMNKEMILRVELERGLRKAIKNEEFFLAYQPIIHPATGSIAACEALLRWDHPKLGIVPPMEFIPLAEETGMIHALGEWILRTACLQVKKWQNEGFTTLSISVNVSAHQLQSNRFIDIVESALTNSNLEARFLHLELTESVMINKSLRTDEIMKALMDMGVNISIDDFGTGYSSLSYLKNLPIHTLKIDRSFIQNLNLQSPDFAIVHAILTMGHGLGLRIVAEGIETDEQLEMLKNLGCDFVQGYFIEKPLEAKRFQYWLEKNRHKFNILS